MWEVVGLFAVVVFWVGLFAFFLNRFLYTGRLTKSKKDG